MWARLSNSLMRMLIAYRFTIGTSFSNSWVRHWLTTFCVVPLWFISLLGIPIIMLEAVHAVISALAQHMKQLLSLCS